MKPMNDEVLDITDHLDQVAGGLDPVLVHYGQPVETRPA